jgi:hypothetical protein
VLYSWFARLAATWPSSLLAAAGVGHLAAQALTMVPDSMQHIAGTLKVGRLGVFANSELLRV